MYAGTALIVLGAELGLLALVLAPDHFVELALRIHLDSASTLFSAAALVGTMFPAGLAAALLYLVRSAYERKRLSDEMLTSFSVVGVYTLNHAVFSSFDGGMTAFVLELCAFPLFVVGSELLLRLASSQAAAPRTRWLLFCACSARDARRTSSGACSTAPGGTSGAYA